ncbi:MAG: DUF4760 domain-containing protein [Aliarcobacter skirrowii]|uniref:DUF4760 domain-containing protein n=1 Tax=Aliarcobacter skirrowii TaxID=28200 RepID=UPI00242D4113|nr:DUF4760 domain-containing protein [Aliarcobacter skirrowii]MDD2508699.1 DUF4760 domain-containing protein [Aliarcobacter skirrowii]MDD3496911.1 DUF4760 domain-containing protein [Aliarcobacter skirrowii]
MDITKKNLKLIILIIFIIMVFFVFSVGADKAIQVQSLANLVIAIGVFFTFMQLKHNKEELKSNHDWNRRQLALTELIKHRKDVTEAIRLLNSNIDYRERKNAYSLNEIHKHLCDDESFDGNILKMTDTGKEIKHNIFVILNYYEYLCIGIENRVFDESIIKDSIKGALIKANKLFGEYIEHLRTDRHTNNKNLFIKQELIAREWSKENSQELNNREKTA